MRKFLLFFLLAGCATPGPSTELNPKALNIADAALNSGDATLALQVSRAVVYNNPGDNTAKIHEANALYALGRIHSAQIIYENIYSKQHDPAIGAALAKCILMENTKKAVKLLKNAVSLDPSNPVFLTNLGVAEDILGKHKEAYLFYNRSLKFDPSNISTRLDLALSIGLSGEPVLSEEMLKSLADSSDSNLRIRQDYGAILAIEGHVNEATSILAIDLPPVQAHSAALSYQALGVNHQVLLQ